MLPSAQSGYLQSSTCHCPPVSHSCRWRGGGVVISMGGGAELVLVFIIPNNASSHQSPALDTVDTGAKTGPPTTTQLSIAWVASHHQTAVRGMMSC